LPTWSNWLNVLVPLLTQRQVMFFFVICMGKGTESGEGGRSWWIQTTAFVFAFQFGPLRTEDLKTEGGHRGDQKLFLKDAGWFIIVLRSWEF
jgi:hypothetical protein